MCLMGFGSPMGMESTIGMGCTMGMKSTVGMKSTIGMGPWVLAVNNTESLNRGCERQGFYVYRKETNVDRCVRRR